MQIDDRGGRPGNCTERIVVHLFLRFSYDSRVVGRVAISTTALLSETIRRSCLCGSITGPADSHSDRATLGLVGYRLITHTGGISGTHGFVYASVHPNGT